MHRGVDRLNHLGQLLGIDLAGARLDLLDLRCHQLGRVLGVERLLQLLELLLQRPDTGVLLAVELEEAPAILVA